MSEPAEETDEHEPRALELSEIDRLGDVWERAWGGGGYDDLALCCTVDVFYEDPLTFGIIKGTGALADHVGGLRKGLPDLRIERTGARVSDGTFACFPWRIAGTHKGQLGEIPATRKFVTMHGLHYIELRDGLITRARGFFDIYDAAMQLGLIPKRGSLGESALMLLRGFGLRAKG